MSFHESAQAIKLVGGHILRAQLRTANGDWADSNVNLDDFIGNNDGHFEINGAGYSNSGRGFHLEISQNGSPYLVGDLQARNGEYRDKQEINLANFISNEDGHLMVNRSI